MEVIEKTAVGKHEMNKMEEKKQREGRGEPLRWLNQWKEMTLASPTGTSADRPPPRPTCTYYRYVPLFTEHT